MAPSGTLSGHFNFTICWLLHSGHCAILIGPVYPNSHVVPASDSVQGHYLAACIVAKRSTAFLGQAGCDLFYVLCANL